MTLRMVLKTFIRIKTYVLYIDIVLVYWLYKNKKPHYLKKTSGKVENRFLFLSSVEQDNFRRFKEELLEEWRDVNCKMTQGM